MRRLESSDSHREVFDDLAPFRELFLSHLTPRGRKEVMDFGRLLAELVLDTERKRTPEIVSPVRAQLQAATEDLRYLQQFLAHLGREPDVVLVSPSDRRLCAFALETSRTLRRLLRKLDARLRAD